MKKVGKSLIKESEEYKVCFETGANLLVGIISDQLYCGQLEEDEVNDLISYLIVNYPNSDVSSIVSENDTTIRKLEGSISLLELRLAQAKNLIASLSAQCELIDTAKIQVAKFLKENE